MNTVDSKLKRVIELNIRWISIQAQSFFLNYINFLSFERVVSFSFLLFEYWMQSNKDYYSHDLVASQFSSLISFRGKKRLLLFSGTILKMLTLASIIVMVSNRERLHVYFLYLFPLSNSYERMISFETYADVQIKILDNKLKTFFDEFVLLSIFNQRR